jgi:cysteine desulfurase
MSERIYLDHSATTPVRPEILDAMLPHFSGAFGNAGSIHAFGREARKAVDDARDHVAALLNADPREIVFTAGGTEADNLAILGVIETSPATKRRIVTTSIEHHAVLHACDRARLRCGAEIVVVPVGRDGLVDPDELLSHVNGHTALVSVMHANNEIGTIQPIEKIATACAERGVLFHTDAVQSAGKIPINLSSTPISFLAMSGHKIYAPKGVGACFTRKGTEFAPQSVGGGQERERRAGTENVAAIVGFGKACELARTDMTSEAARVGSLRDRLESQILAAVSGAVVNGARDRRLPNLSNVYFPGVEGESVILGLDMEGIAVSSGSACTSGSLEPSHVLLALGLDYERAQSAVRFSLGRGTSEQDIERAIAATVRVVRRLLGN